ncbi:MAG: hypothetical protein A2Y38_15170 [Spirochaetes bacterium GWB1_59_5]|nr:MAG: hypothetical protein A2Y38_15170 [Spirochaetes bacterium GWB1_59_5]
MKTEGNGMRIIGLEAENFKRLVAVSLKLDGGHLILGGENESGKTSVLDAIWVALGGPDVMRDLKISRPIREGAETARITLDLGDLVVTRNWTANDKQYLKVATKDGAAYSSPQAMLDRLIGKVFDPLEFSRLKDGEQREMLLSLVDIELSLDAWADERKEVYDERTEINREYTRLNNRLESAPLVEAPDEEISSADVFTEMEAAQALKEAYDDVRRKASAAEIALERAERDVTAEEENVRVFEAEFQKAKGRLAAAIKDCEGRRAEQGQLAQEAASLKDPDMTAFQTRLQEVEAVNAKVRANREKEAMIEEWKALGEQSRTLTRRLAALETQKANAIQSAKFPIDGLGFDDSGVTFNNIPFGQCSSEERIRVGMAIAMAMNPTLKVIRIAEGSLLDEKNFGLIQGIASEQGYQLLIEKVGDPGAMGIVIEDGAVKPAEEAVHAV